ncbi:PALP domain-containing protein [Metabacillus arenae]|uniref:Diaminopropionate ammonia-lyase n=1 Tax=Metabacillus arenae TaxID=2771434 RepID=A0A926NNW6_9BACI|nr:hypothetical protein [Metabacillus arenae]MBD1383378.1 hypothetical protein [Metabacillus arenae]
MEKNQQDELKKLEQQRNKIIKLVSCPDYVAGRGMRILANPLGYDPHIISGESGAVGMGLVSLVAENTLLKDVKEALKLNQDSKILIISTEGDTDPDHYRKVVWDGAYPSVELIF